MSPVIVAEVSKNWILGEEPQSPLLSQEFERVILVNLERGYVLRTFQLHRVLTSPKVLNETIIAVFVLGVAHG